MEHDSFLKEEINPSMDQQDTCYEHQWRIDVEKIVSERGSRQRRESSSVCIFRVPKFLIDMNPKAYIPQVVSLGPLHWKTLSTQMLDHKAEAVCKMLGSLQGRDINFLVKKISKLDEEIRSCYDEVIKCDKETLALMMTLDGCFLLEFFWTFICNANPSETVNFEPISIFAENKIEFLRGYMVLRDIMMLENQIPLCVLVELLKLELNSSDMCARKALCDLAYPCLMSKASPFKFPHHPETLENLEAELKPQELMKNSKTLLDFWRLCMKAFLNAEQMSPSSCDDGTLGPRPSALDNPIPRCPVPCGASIPRRPVNSSAVPSEALHDPDVDSSLALSEVMKSASDRRPREFKDPPCEPSPPRRFRRAAIDNPIPVPSGEFEEPQLETPPHEPSAHGPLLREFVVPYGALDNPIPRAPVPCGASDNAIPSILPARNLKIAGIEIKACKRDKLNEIRFENKGLCGAALFLPQLFVTDTTEIVIRNLLALEECRASPPNTISRYIQLLDMLIDGREDVSLLIKNGVIDNYLGSEEEIAALFNSLCKGISVKHSPEFDAVLTQVKEYHDGKWNVVIAEFVQKHFSSPWVTLALVASILILVMTALQTVYSVYSAYNK